MNKTLTTLLLAACTFSSGLQAQPADPKLEWATRLVALQQGPDLDSLVEQLATSASQDLIGSWEPRLEIITPAAKQAKVAEEINAEIIKFATDANKIIASKVAQVSRDALVPAYMDRFTLDELKQLTAFFESPAVKKYKATTPALVNVFVQKLIESSRGEIQTRAKQFDEVAGKIAGPLPAAKPPVATPAKPAKK
ncbi:MAG: DUF2059 domain-containing protein [Polaromonas sp.]|uniref:DUF2059 domain-containing protein n=1 Tax=Polaromonas sp. TaxID=1869339 RepID=UPI00272F7307|nr:DUF2059 domain-containing protein [Polaromonas sp.]MDP1742090.1 DUF2059 domain-containing protein [Polaromonas sp.]MDP1954789.1 DUF2059 domain-containing protein [Polaromonas sp.]MDP3356640.1 DUF2059 domain-containing protein [Polaromonas sp.]MDP3809499.1 DUF2059 domain-containing protein [Hydrogenophaga sp.]